MSDEMMREAWARLKDNPLYPSFNGGQWLVEVNIWFEEMNERWG